MWYGYGCHWGPNIKFCCGIYSFNGTKLLTKIEIDFLPHISIAQLCKLRLSCKPVSDVCPSQAGIPFAENSQKIM